MEWGWPQWVIAGCYALVIVVNAINHDKPRTGKFNALSGIVSVAIGAFILHKGGFW